MRFLMLPLVAVALAAQTPDPEWLEASWKQMPGDRIEWAQPAFDDSAWPQIRRSARNQKGDPRGATWFRTTFVIPEAWVGRELALTSGNFDDASETYVEGEKIASFGVLPPVGTPATDRSVVVYARKHIVQNIPPHLVHGREVHVAVRRWIRNGRIGFQAHVPFFGNSEHVTLLGPAERIANLERLHNIDGAWSRALQIGVRLVTLAMGMLCLVWFTGDRSRREYLWIGLAFVAEGGHRLIGIPMYFDWLARTSFLAFLTALIFYPLPFFGNVVVSAELTRNPLLRKTLRVLAVVAIVFPVYLPLEGWYAADSPLLRQSTQATLWIVAVTSLAAVTLAARERRWVDSLLLLTLAVRWVLLDAGNRVRPFTLGPFLLSNAEIGSMLVVGTLLLLLGRRYSHDRQISLARQRDYQAAQRIQQHLLAPPVGEKSGFQVTALTIPAGEVGGDFYQVLARQDGSHVIVAGDVSGKGLDAAMLVAMILGALEREESSSPAAVLAGLNEMLTRRSTGGFVTCCCLRLRHDGEVTIANAGHVAPWLDGAELALEPGLPLGVAADAEWMEQSVAVSAGQQLVVVSDGVVEAASSSGELYGFERTRGIATKAAREIAAAAKQWGQNDDITVVTVRRPA